MDCTVSAVHQPGGYRQGARGWGAGAEQLLELRHHPAPEEGDGHLLALVTWAACTTAPPWARIQNSLGLLLSSRDPVTSRYILGAPLPRLNHYYNYFNMNSHVAAGIGAKTVFESRYECFHLLEVTVRPWTDTAPLMLSISRLVVRTVTALFLSLF